MNAPSPTPAAAWTITSQRLSSLPDGRCLSAFDSRALHRRTSPTSTLGQESKTALAGQGTPKLIGQRRAASGDFDRDPTTGESRRSLWRPNGVRAAGIPALVGESIITGGLANSAGGLVGRGAQALGAGAELSSLAGGAARIGAQNIGTPSMWLPEAVNNAGQNGGEWYNFRNLAPALAVGTANTAVLGSLARFGGNGIGGLIRRVGRSARRAAAR